MRFARDVPIQDLHIVRRYPPKRFDHILDYIWFSYVHPDEPIGALPL